MPGFDNYDYKGLIGKIQTYFNAGEICHQLEIEQVFKFQKRNMNTILTSFFTKNDITLMYNKIKEKKQKKGKNETVFYYLENFKQKYWEGKELDDMFGGILGSIKNRIIEESERVFIQNRLCPYMANEEINSWLDLPVNQKHGPPPPPPPPLPPPPPSKKGGKRHKIVKKNRTLRKRKRKKKIQTKFKPTNKIISKRRGTINKKRRRTIKNKTKN
jgi:hypothetical protein